MSILENRGKKPTPEVVKGKAKWVVKIVPETFATFLGSGVIFIQTEKEKVGQEYLITPITDYSATFEPDLLGYRLSKTDGSGTTYDVSLDCTTSCDCADSVFKSDRRPDGLCKHRKALLVLLRAVGVKVPSRPVPTPYRSAGDYAAQSPEQFDDHMNDVA